MNFHGTVHDPAGNVFNYATLAKRCKLDALNRVRRLKQNSSQP